MAAPVVRNGNVVVNSIDFALSAVATLALLQINLTGLKKIGTVAERAFDAFLRIAHFDTSVQDSNAQYAASFIPQWFRNQFAGSRPYDAAQEVVVNGKRVEVYTEGNKHHQLIISGLVMCATTTLILQLIDEGKLTLRTPVAAILPAFAETGKGTVTIEDFTG